MIDDTKNESAESTVDRTPSSEHDRENDACPWNDPEMYANPATNGLPCACCTLVAVTVGDSTIQDVADAWPWNGSWYPENSAFDDLKLQVPEAQYDALRTAIATCAARHNARLE